MNPTRRYCELYDLAVTLSGDIPLYTGLLSDRVRHVVEIGCGTGRITFPLARNGHRVMGTDVAPAMLEVARDKLIQEPKAVQERVAFQVGNMLDVALPDDLDTFLLPYNVLKYNTTRDEQARFLAACACRLPKAGRLLVHCDVDRFEPGSIPLGRRIPLFTHRVDPLSGNEISSFHIIHEIDGGTATIVAEAVYVEHLSGGQDITHAFTGRMRMLRDPFEVVNLCRKAGLEVIDAWGGFDKSPLTAAAAKVIVLAERE